MDQETEKTLQRMMITGTVFMWVHTANLLIVSMARNLSAIEREYVFEDGPELGLKYRQAGIHLWPHLAEKHVGAFEQAQKYDAELDKKLEMSGTDKQKRENLRTLVLVANLYNLDKEDFRCPDLERILKHLEYMHSEGHINRMKNMGQRIEYFEEIQLFVREMRQSTRILIWRKNQIKENTDQTKTD